jgi:hypothetical protein
VWRRRGVSQATVGDRNGHNDGDRSSRHGCGMSTLSSVVSISFASVPMDNGLSRTDCTWGY